MNLISFRIYLNLFKKRIRNIFDFTHPIKKNTYLFGTYALVY